jgi:hypothetical protein
LTTIGDNAVVRADNLLFYGFGVSSEIRSGKNVSYYAGVNTYPVTASFQAKTIGFDENTAFRTNGLLMFSDVDAVLPGNNVRLYTPTALTINKGSAIQADETVFYVSSLQTYIDGQKSLISGGDVTFGLYSEDNQAISILAGNTSQNYPVINTKGIVKFIGGRYTLPLYFIKSASLVLWENAELLGASGIAPHIFAVLKVSVPANSFRTLRILYADLDNVGNATNMTASEAAAAYASNNEVVEKLTDQFSAESLPAGFEAVALTAYTYQAANVEVLKSFGQVFDPAPVEAIAALLTSSADYTNTAVIYSSDNSKSFEAQRIQDGHSSQLVKAIIPDLASADWGSAYEFMGKFSVDDPESFANENFTLSRVPEPGAVFMTNVYTPKLDENGNVMTDENGEPIMENDQQGHTGIVTNVTYNPDGSYTITLMEQNYSGDGLGELLQNEYGVNADEFGEAPGNLGVITTTRQVTIHPDNAEDWVFVTNDQTKQLAAPTVDSKTVNDMAGTMVDSGFTKLDGGKATPEQLDSLGEFMSGFGTADEWGNAVDAMHVISNIYTLTLGDAPDLDPLLEHVSNYLSLSPADQSKYLYTLTNELKPSRAQQNI